MPDAPGPSSKIWSYAVVILFSAVIVAMGAKELERRFAKKGGERDIKELVRELKGDPQEMRASLARRTPKAEAEQPKKDVIDSDDRKELKNIIDKIAP